MKLWPHFYYCYYCYHYHYYYYDCCSTYDNDYTAITTTKTYNSTDTLLEASKEESQSADAVVDQLLGCCIR